MLTKTYFVKVSWTDPEQPLKRVHENYDSVEIEVGKGARGIGYQIHDQVVPSYERREEFTVDFVMEVPSE